MNIDGDATTSGTSTATQDEHATTTIEEEDEQPVRSGMTRRGKTARMPVDPDQDEVDDDPDADEEE